MPITARSRRRLLIVAIVAALGAAGLYAAYYLAERSQDTQARASFDKAEQAFEEERYEQSLHHYGMFIRRFGNEATPDLLYKYAISRFNQPLPNGRHVIDTVNVLERVVDRDITHQEARKRLLELRLALGQNLETEALARRIIEQDDTDINAWRARAIAQQKLRKFGPALEAAEKLNQLDPDDVTGHLLTLSILRERGDSPDDMLAYANQAVRDADGSLPTQMMLANAYILDGRIREAIQVVRSLETVALTDAESALQVVTQFERLGGAAADASLIRTAMETARKANERFDAPGLHRWLATRLLAERQFDDVLDLTKHIETEQNWRDEAPSLAPLRALALLDSGQTEPLGPLLNRMAEDDRGVVRDWAALLELLRSSREATGVELVNAAQSVLDNDRGHPFAMLWLAQGQIRQQNPDDAIDTLGRLVSIIPSWGTPRVAHLRLLLDNDRDAEAAEHASRALRLFNRSEEVAVLWARASAAALEGRPEGPNAELLTRVRQLRDALPDRGELALLEVELLTRLERPDQARAAARAALDTDLRDAQLIRLSEMNEQANLGLQQQINGEMNRRTRSAPMVLMRADRLVKQGDIQEAINVISDAMDNADDQDHPAFLVALAQARERTDPQAALKTWRQASDAHPENLAVHRALLNSQVAWRDAELTEDAIDRLSNLVGDSVGWKQARARWLLRHSSGTQDVAAAADLLGETLRVAPDQAAAHRLLAEAMIQLGNLPMAESSLRQAASLQDSDAAVYIQLAELAMRRADPTAADSYLDQALSLDINDSHRLAASQLYRRLGHPDRAVAILRQVSQSADRRQVALLSAQALLEIGDEQTALNTLRPWSDSRDTAVWGLQARALARLDDTQGLIDLRNRIDRPSALPDELVVLGYVATLLNNPDNAEAAYRRALDAEPSHDRAMAGLLRTMLSQGRADEAASTARNAAQRDDAPDVANTVASLLDTYRQSEKPTILSLALAATTSDVSDDALRSIANALQTTNATLDTPDTALIRAIGRIAQDHPRDLLVSNLHARALLGAGQLDESLRVINGVIANDPTNAAAHGLRTQVYMDMGRYRDVLDAVTRWSELRADAGAQLDAIAAQAALELGDPEQAVAALTEHEDEMMAILSETDVGLRLYISALAQSNRLDRVRDLLGPRLESSLFARALYARAGADYIQDLDTAKAWIERLEEATPDDDEATLADIIMMRRVLGIRFGDEAMVARSRAMASELARRDDLPPSIWFRLGVEAELLGDPNVAEQRYRMGYSPAEQTAAIANNLAMILARKGEGEDAVRFAQSAVDWLPNEPEFYDTLAYAYVAANNPRGAIEPMQQAMELDPQNPEWPLHLAEIYDQMGNGAERDRLLMQIDRQTLSGEQLPADLRVRFEQLRERSPSLSDAALGTDAN